MSKQRAGFTIATAQQFKNSLLGDCLADVVDCVRDINTQLGVYNYTVALVHTRWTGGKRNKGVEEVICRELILPTPKLEGLDPVEYQLQPVGSDEIGFIRVTKISPHYTEEQLRGLGVDGSAIPDDVSFYWEIAYPKSDNTELYRRFIVNNVPAYHGSRVEWTVTLQRVGEDRVRKTGDTQ